MEKIPIRQIIAECDKYFNSGKPEKKGRLLLEWLEKARSYKDEQGELTMMNELIGHYRMAGDAERGISIVREALALMEKINESDTLSGGTILLNAGTALHSFGRNDEAVQCYERAMKNYSQNLPSDDIRFAGLYNNASAAYASKGDFDTAQEFCFRALDILSAADKYMDMAVTLVNLAMLPQKDQEMTSAYLDSALECFYLPDVCRDGYFAHTCTKCAGAFESLGRFGDAEKLKKMAQDFYEGDRTLSAMV